MKKIKPYNLFLESNSEIDIYEFSNMMKGWRFTHSLSEIKKHSERFIGPGVFDRVQKLVDQIFDSLKEVDIEYIKEMLYDVFDEFPEKKYRVHLAVLYCDPENLNRPLERRFNGSMTVAQNVEESRQFITSHILLDMMTPTFRIAYPSIEIRQTDEQLYVRDPKWNCLNFNIDNYEISKKAGQNLPNPTDYKKRETYISPTDIEKLRKYNLEDYFECYKPGIYIEIYDERTSTWKVNIKKIEDVFDRNLPQILRELDYEKVLWETDRENRQFDETTYDVYDYTLKILLKM